MRTRVGLLLYLMSLVTVQAQTLYHRAFGRPEDPPMVFLHGGPGSSSVYFEATTARQLAQRGFFVIVYNRRGEGRSKDPLAKMNFEEALTDLNQIYRTYRLTKANLIGFSFGGLIATQYAQKYPHKVKALLLCSALVSQQQSYNTVLRTTKTIYEQRNDTTDLHELVAINQLDTTSLAYRTLVFKHASANGFFTLRQPNELARQIYSTYPTDTLISRYVKNEQAVDTFWQHERDHNIDVTPILKRLRQDYMPIYALYGKQDGLYSPQQIAELERLLSPTHVRYLDTCSHTVFIDQQALFLAAASRWLNQDR